jgi:hypothetical protein
LNTIARGTAQRPARCLQASQCGAKVDLPLVAG